MTPNIEVTNPPPTHLPPLPGPGDVRLDWVPVTKEEGTNGIGQ